MPFFDATSVEPVTGELQPIPRGIYIVSLQFAEEKEKKDDPSSTFLSCKFQVLDGQYAKRVIFDNFTLKNRNQNAVDIGRGKLAALCLGAGKAGVQQWSEIYGIPVRARIDISPESNGYKAKNTISGFVLDNVAATSPATGGTAPAKPAEVKLRTDGVMTPEVSFVDDDIPF